MELLVVIGIITTFVGVIGYGFLRGSASSTVGLQAAQSMIVALLTQARSQAILTGREAAVLVHSDKEKLPERYMRYLVPAVRNDDGIGWIPLSAGVFLPDGCVVVPNPAPTGDWIESGEDWGDVKSTAMHDLASELVSASIESTEQQKWNLVEFAKRGTRVPGYLVVSNRNVRPPNSSTLFQFINPQNVRGVAITQMGNMRLLNSREDFAP